MKLLIGSAALLVGCAASAPPPAIVPPTQQSLPTQIIAPHAEGNSRELFARGEAALAARNWSVAIDNFTALLNANEPSAANLFPTAMFDLGVAYEGSGARKEARDDYAHLALAYPENAVAKQAEERVLDLDAFLEDWADLGKTAQIVLDRNDADDVGRMTALGGRGLSEIELGDDVHAGRDVEDGLEIAERLNIGAGGRLPASVAQLRFALGEIRRVRSERIHFVPDDIPDAMNVPADFLQKMNARCDGLMDAQHAYGEAMRSIDAHWIAMSGFRVGEMYRKLHHDLMVIPPTLFAKSDKQKQIFFAIMHVRYRVLLEKGDDMMDRTISVANAGLDSSDWISRARALKADIELALDEEKAMIKSFPFTEDEIKKAIEILRKKAEDQKKNQPTRP
jgi:tetratricopeptide (TPR) repeat protein